MKLKVTIAFLLIATTLFAQTKEDKKLFATFVSVCNTYKQFPLQLTVEYSKASNFPLPEEDSKVKEGLFCFEKGAAYIKFGELEQVMNDSLALVIMTSIKHMVLSQKNKDEGDQLNKLMNIVVTDSSIKTLAKKYNITQKAVDNNIGSLKITSKKNLTATELPSDELLVLYNLKTQEPQRIETLKRGLIKKERVTADMKVEATTVTIPQKGDYLLKEDKTIFVYKSIAHVPNYAIPVKIADRIAKDDTEIYIPAKGFETYKLTIN
jgi:hypothetical protein